MKTLYEEIGGMPTCRRLSERFHERIADDAVLRPHFPKSLVAVTEHLALFLAEQLGGPAEYTARRGKPRLICRHAHLPIGAEEGGRWLGHMFAAMEEVGVPERAGTVLRDYLSETAATLADPLLPYYRLPLDELRALLERCPAVATTIDHGRSLLRDAAQRWDRPRVELLLERGANIHGKDLLGHDALYHATCARVPGREDEGAAVVALLLRHGAPVDGRSGPGRMTPLHMTARRGTIALAEALLEAGAEIEAKDLKEETPLRRAVNCGQEEVVALLIARGADPHSRDKQGRTPLDAARTQPIRRALGGRG